MSHSKGFLRGRCPGNFRNYGRPKDGQRQQRCPRCGMVRWHTVRPCFMFHDWSNQGRPEYGEQGQKCTKCGSTRTVQRSSCFMFHRWSGKRQPPGVLRCVNCGTVKS